MSATPLHASSSNALASLPRVAVAGIVLVVLGAFGAWATVDVAGTDVGATKTGLDGDGGITLVLALIAAAMVGLAVRRPARWHRFALLAPAVLIALIAVIDTLDVMGTGNGVIDVSVGWGLWLTLIGGAALLADAARRLRS